MSKFILIFCMWPSAVFGFGFAVNQIPIKQCSVYPTCYSSNLRSHSGFFHIERRGKYSLQSKALSATEEAELAEMKGMIPSLLMFNVCL